MQDCQECQKECDCISVAPICPKCHTNDFIKFNGHHYVCTHEEKDEDENIIRCLAQFYVREDKELQFPYNIIFSGRKPNEFFRLPYITYSEQ